MPKVVHPVAGTLALAMVLLFWSSTVISELVGGTQAVVTVKTLIPWGFLVLVPAMMLAGGSGTVLAGRWRGDLVTRKRRRMAVIAANGLLVLVPAALYLSAKARAGAFDTGFAAVQAVEIAAGALNLALLALNLRDGIRMSNRRRTRPARP